LIVHSERRDSERGDFCFAATHGAILLRDLRAVLGPHVRLVAPDGFGEFRALIEEAGAAAEGLLVSVATVPSVCVAARGEPLPKRSRRRSGTTRTRLDYHRLGCRGRARPRRRLRLDARFGDGQLLRVRARGAIVGSFGFDAKGDATCSAVTMYCIEHGRR
jgi:hypothetical protein